MKTITGVIIAKNEELMIADALDSLSFCDEIVVVDNNSTDRTSEIAKHLNARIIETDSSDFSHIRNLAIKNSRTDYIFYVDADERVSKKLRDSVKEMLSKDNPMSAYYIYRNNFYLGKNEWPEKERILRIFRKSDFKKWVGNLHESPDFEGKSDELSGFLIHFTHRDLSQMLNKTINWSSIEAKNRFDTKHPKMRTWRFPRVMISTFFRYYIKEKGYKLGTAGLIESIYQTYSIFITYAKLWELQENENN